MTLTLKKYDYGPNAPKTISEWRLLATKLAKTYVRAQAALHKTVPFETAYKIILDEDPGLKAVCYPDPKDRFTDPRQAVS